MESTVLFSKASCFLMSCNSYIRIFVSTLCLSVLFVTMIFVVWIPCVISPIAMETPTESRHLNVRGRTGSSVLAEVVYKRHVDREPKTWRSRGKNCLKFTL